MTVKEVECCIIGAGPAGLGAAQELVKRGVKSILIIDRNTAVGGLCRTDRFGPARFDVGPHRFYTKNKEINSLWHETLGKDFIPVDRLTRIYYKNRYFDYPLKLGNVLHSFGPIESAHAMISFVKAQMRKKREAETFEDWVCQRFGSKLYETFFKTYTEKVWGIPCREIGADWAAQRIKDLNMFQLIKSLLFPQTNGSGSVKTLVDQFDYPVLGAGQMYEVMCDKIVAAGAELRLGVKVKAVNHSDGWVDSITAEDASGAAFSIRAKQFFSSIPITQFFKMLSPGESAPVEAAADALYYREHITVNMLIDSTDIFPDQWIYIHSPDVRVARIANYNNFSKAMVSVPGKTAISAEYFAFQHEDLWKAGDADIARMAADELDHIGLVEKRRVEQCWIVKETECYPTYFAGYQIPYNILKERMAAYRNLCCLGRAGMYKYNNQDHSLISGILAARNYVKTGDAPFDLWKINVDTAYLESGSR